PGMELAPAAERQTFVRSITHERVTEPPASAALGYQDRCEHAPIDARERSVLDQRFEQGRVDARADHRRRTQDPPLVQRQPVDLLRDEPLYRRGQTLVAAVAIRGDQLLEEQRVPAGSIGQ